MARVESVLAGIVAVVAACGDATGEGGAPPLNLLLLAGDIGGAGNVDGTGAAARFNQPSGVAVDSAGNVYVADYLNSTIRKVTPTGLVTTLAGTAGMVGSADGPGAAARFSQPAGVAVDSVGNVYVADQSNHTIRKVTAAGVVTTLAGTAGVVGSVDGPGAAARFYYPTSVAVDSSDNVYVADQSNSTIRKVSVTGTVMTLAGSAGRYGSADGTGAAASFNLPGGVAVDGAGNVYVADSINNTVRKVTAAGVVTTLAGAAGTAGSADGKGAAARFNQPAGVAVDRAGNIYVADQGNATVRKATADGVVTTLAGAAGVPGSVDGTGAGALFNSPSGVAVDSAGNVYVADSGNSTLRKVTLTGTTTTIAGTPGAASIALGATPRFGFPQGLAIVVDSLLVSDANAILLLANGAR
jgi:secreted PhoX family phosphatase